MVSELGCFEAKTRRKITTTMKASNRKLSTILRIENQLEGAPRFSTRCRKVGTASNSAATTRLRRKLTTYTQAQSRCFPAPGTRSNRARCSRHRGREPERPKERGTAGKTSAQPGRLIPVGIQSARRLVSETCAAGTADNLSVISTIGANQSCTSKAPTSVNAMLREQSRTERVACLGLRFRRQDCPLIGLAKRSYLEQKHSRVFRRECPPRSRLRQQ